MFLFLSLNNISVLFISFSMRISIGSFAEAHWSFVWKTLLNQRPKPHDCKIPSKTAVFGGFWWNLCFFGKEKTCFCENCGFWWKPLFLMEKLQFLGLKVVKLSNSFQSGVRIQGGNIIFFLDIHKKSAVCTKNCSFHQNPPNERPVA